MTGYPWLRDQQLLHSIDLATSADPFESACAIGFYKPRPEQLEMAAKLAQLAAHLIEVGEEARAEGEAEEAEQASSGSAARVS